MASKTPSHTIPYDDLQKAFGEHLQENALMSNYSTSNIGGPADALLVVQSSRELEYTICKLWELDIPFHILGSCSNVLVSEKGIREVVIINHARTVKVNTRTEPPTVHAETGASLSSVAKRVALRGLSGLEWSTGIPGTVGGAVYGNAGAFGGDIKGSLVLAEILHHKRGRETWPCGRFEYSYRSSLLKRRSDQVVILAAQMKLIQSTREEVETGMEAIRNKRLASQPPGNSLGSIFKNPTDEHAARLIEQAGLKGTQIGGALISDRHANIIVNDGAASANDVWELIRLAKMAVKDKFGIELELEIERLGDWSD